MKRFTTYFTEINQKNGFKNLAKRNLRLLASVVGIMWSVLTWGQTTYYSRAAGNWNTNSTWSTVSHTSSTNTGTFPVAGDIVYIQHAITFIQNAACSTIYFDGTGTLSPITINSPYTLTVSGTIELTSSPTTTTYTMTGTGTVSCQNINCGTNLGTGFLSNTVTLALKSSLSNLTCSNTLTVRANAYNGYKINTEFDLLSGTMNLGYLVVTTEALTLLDAKFTNTGTSTLKFTGTGTVVTKSGGQGATSATETVDFTGSTVEYVGTANQTIFATNYKGLRIANTAATATLGGNINVSGNWDNDGTFSASTYDVTFNGTIGQSITGDNTTNFNKIYVNNSNTLTLTRNVSATELNYINASGTATFLISTGVTLTLSGALKKTSFAGADNISVLSGAGNLTCSSIDIGSTSVTGSNVATTITFTTTLSSLNCTGNLTVTSSYISSYRVSTVFNINSGTIQVANIIQVKDGVVTNTNQLLNTGSPFDSILKISGATGITAAAAGSIINLTGASSTVEYNGSVAQNVYPTTYNTLKINNTHASGCSLTGSASTKNLELTSGILTTTDTNRLTVTTGTTSGSATSYVNGPLSIERTFIQLTPYPTFHVGKGGRYLPVTINSITSTTNPTITIEAFSDNVAGTISASGFCSLSTTEYWNMIYTASNNTDPKNIILTVQRPEALGDLNILTSTATVTSGSNYGTDYFTRGGASITPNSLKNSSVLPATSQSGSKLRLVLGSSTKLIGGTATPTSNTLCYNTSTTVSLSGNSSNSSGSIQWQQSADGSTGWANVTGGSGATTATYTTPSLTTTTYYRAIISGSSPCSPTTATSSTATVTVNPTNTNTWSGATSTDWNTDTNWVCSTKPSSSTNVVIPSGATNMPNISSAVAVANSVTINSGATLTMGNYTLTLTDGGSFTNNGTFTAGTGTVTFAGVGTIAGSGSLTFNNLTITGGTGKGVVANKDFTVNGVLNLGTNPNATDGALDMVIDYGNYATGAYTSDLSYNLIDPTALTTANTALKDNTSTYNNLNSYVLLLGPSASTTGTGDVTGKIRRTSFNSGQTYTFGNTNTLLTFTANNINELPTQITVVATRGPKGRHADKSNETNKTSIKRLYQILRTGGETTTKFTVRFPYEQSEVENNTNENNLVLWDHHIPYSGITPHEHGKTFNSSVDNYVELSNHGLYYLANETIPLVENYFTKYWMISESVIPIPTWLGAVPGGSWTSASNWTSGVVPTTTSSIIIPDQVNTPNNPNLGSDLTLGTIEIQPGGVLSAGARNITLTGGVAENGGRGTWINSGTFNAGTGTVIFDKAGATYAGNTAFNNITINTGKSLILQNGSTLKIGNTLTNNGTLDASSNPNTIEYNGTAEQTTTGLPANIRALTINNVADVTLTNDITIASNLTLTNGNLNVGANTLTYSGSNISKTGGFINASSNNPTLNFTNTEDNLDLPASLFVDDIIYNMTINGSGGITLGSNTTITNDLTLTNGNLNVGANTLTYSGSSISKSSGFINASSNNATLNLTNTGALNLPENLFVDGTVYNMTINGSGGATLGSDTTVSNQLTLTSGNFNLGDNTLTLNGPYISGSPDNLIATSSSSINFNNTGATSVTLPNFTAINNLGFNASAMTYNLGNNITVHGDLNITNGTVNSSSYTLNRNEAGGTLSLGNGSSLLIGGTNTFPTNFTTHSINEASSVTYNGTDQAVGQLNSSQSYGNLTLSGTGTKTFTDDTGAKISGHFSIEGSTVTPPTKLTFNGTSTQNIAGLPYNNIEFSEAGTKTFTSSASLSPTAEITFSGTPGMVDFDGVNNNLEFVLQSTTEGTARVGNTGNTSNTTGWTLNGQLRAERFVPAKRAWRLLTAPLKGNANNSIYANWQGTTNEGLLLWHPQGGGDTGLAVGPQSNIWSYSGTGWASVTNTNTANLYDGSTNNAYLVFATGFFGSQNISSGADATTIRAKGALITGDKDYSLVANQFKLIGNPYASPINTEVMVSDLANSGSKIWLLDPTNGLGAYVTYDGTNWSVPTPSGNDKYIQSGQAFFIRSNSNTFTVKESHKVAGNSNTWFERNANNETNLENSDRIRVLLYKQDTNNWLFADGALAVNSSNGNNNVDDTDATKISNFNESLMFRNGTTNLSIEYRALPQLGDLQPLRLTGTTNGSYQLRLYTENYTNSTIQPYLEDTQTTSIYEIPTDGSEIIVPFEGVVSNSSNPITRFRIVYQTTLSTEDPMNFGVSIYPNPVKNGYLTISLDNYSSNTTYSLTNLLGQQVQSGNLLLLDNLINVNTLQKGVYIINIKQQEKYYSKKLIIN